MNWKHLILIALTFISCKAQEPGVPNSKPTPGLEGNPIGPSTLPPGGQGPGATPPTGQNPPGPGPTATVDPLRLTIDFANFPVNLTHLKSMSPIVRDNTSGFNFGIGTADGQRPNMNNVTWPDSTYYQTVLGSFPTLAAWDMRSLILYSSPKAGGWQKNGWTFIQDMAEGGTCVDDTARGALAVMDHYIAAGDENSYIFARSLLNWLGYMVTLEGNVYNFAWLDSAKFFTADDIQKSNSHYLARFDFVKRWRYPASYPQGSPDADDEGKVKLPNAVPAPPYRGHSKYSIFMNDLNDIAGNDLATVYDVPLYHKSSGERADVQRGIKTSISTSHQGFNAWTARNLWAFAKAHTMMQKRLSLSKSLNAEDIVLAKFIENHFNRMLNFVMNRPNILSLDMKQKAVIISALTEYLKATTTSKDFPAYKDSLPANGNSTRTSDDRTPASEINALLNRLVTQLNAQIYRSNDWKNGIFMADPNGDWDAWGELQIYALASYAEYRFDANDRSLLAAAALETATIAADGFYGREGYHYKDTSNEMKRTRERVTQIRNGAAQYHSTPGAPQLNFGISNTIVGLWQLARAYEKSGRTDAVAKRDEYHKNLLTLGSWYIGNNTALSPMYQGRKGAQLHEGNGAVLDAIDANGKGGYTINAGSGGEANAEGMRAIVLIHEAIQKYKLKTSMTILK